MLPFSLIKFAIYCFNIFMKKIILNDYLNVISLLLDFQGTKTKKEERKREKNTNSWLYADFCHFIWKFVYNFINIIQFSFLYLFVVTVLLLLLLLFGNLFLYVYRHSLCSKRAHHHIVQQQCFLFNIFFTFLWRFFLSLFRLLFFLSLLPVLMNIFCYKYFFFLPKSAEKKKKIFKRCIEK